MKPENYLNVVKKLNDEIYEVGISDFGMGFYYASNDYVDIIEFMGIQVLNSEIDFGIETEEQLEEFIRSQVLALTNDLCRWQRKQFKQEYNCEWVDEDNILEKAKFSEQDLKDLNG